MKVFQGRVITPGTVTALAVVTTQGFNTLASLQMALQFGDKEVKCGDQNNSELHGKPLIGKALCLPQTIGSTTGGLVLYCACAMERNPVIMCCVPETFSLCEYIYTVNNFFRTKDSNPNFGLLSLVGLKAKKQLRSYS